MSRIIRNFTISKARLKDSREKKSNGNRKGKKSSRLVSISLKKPTSHCKERSTEKRLHPIKRIEKMRSHRFFGVTSMRLKIEYVKTTPLTKQNKFGKNVGLLVR